MPYVTVTKPTRIMNPNFDGLQYWRGNQLQTRTGFTVELKPGDTYFTGSILPAPVGLMTWGGVPLLNGGNTEKVMVEIDEWENPTYVYFDAVFYRGHYTGSAGIRRRYDYLYGSYFAAHDNFRSRWNHNGRYFYKGREVKKPNVQGFPTLYYSEFSKVSSPALNAPLHPNELSHMAAPNVGILCEGIQLNIGGANMPANWLNKTAEAEFGGLFKIEFYTRGGGQAYGMKFVIRAPLNWNYAITERADIKDFLNGISRVPGDSNIWVTNTFPQINGSKVPFATKVAFPASGAEDIYTGLGMLGTDGDSITFSPSTNTLNQGETERHRFRFEIPYGLQ